MDLTPHVDNLRSEFLLAAEARSEEALELAESLVAPLDSSVRLTLLNVLSSAADEITRDIAPGSIEIRLRGLDPSFVVTPPPVDPPFEPAVDSGNGATPVPIDDEGPTARINFRPPEHLKARIEEAANREGLSVNAWLVRTVAATLGGAANRPDRGERRAQPGGNQRFTGWVR